MKPAIDRERLLTTIRAAVKKTGGAKPPTFLAFLREAGIPHSRFYKHYTGWNEALKAAGFDFQPQGETIPADRLLADWGEVIRKIQRVPSAVAYDLHGKYSASTCGTRFGSYRNVAVAFEKFVKNKREWADVLAIFSKRKRDGRTGPLPPHPPRKMRSRPGLSPGAKKGTPLPGRPVYGEPLHLPGLGTAPVNETGIVFLFGMLAGPLGFQVQSLRTAFPDCEARRDMGSGHWQPVTIEFEYESRNFRDHGHDPKGCDLIVCWRHNWPDCPKNLEVIALSEELKRLAPIAVNGTQSS